MWLMHQNIENVVLAEVPKLVVDASDLVLNLYDLNTFYHLKCCLLFLLRTSEFDTCSTDLNILHDLFPVHKWLLRAIKKQCHVWWTTGSFIKQHCLHLTLMFKQPCKWTEWCYQVRYFSYLLFAIDKNVGHFYQHLPIILSNRGLSRIDFLS